MTHKAKNTPRRFNPSAMGMPLGMLLSASMLVSGAGGCKAVQKHRERKAAEREAKQLEEMQSNRDDQQARSNSAQPVTEPEWQETQRTDTQPPTQRGTQSEWTMQQRPRNGSANSGNTSSSSNNERMEVIDDRPSSTSNPSGSTSGSLSGNEPMIDLPSPKSREEQSMARAVELYSQGDLEAALRELERAIAINPRFTRAYIESGDIYMEMAEYELAERQFAAAVRNEPRNYMAQYRHASVLHKLGSLEESKRAYLRALSIRPSAFDANLGLSIVQLESGSPAQAVSYAQRAVRADPPSGRARMHLGNVYAAMDQHEEAIVEYQQAADMLDTPGTGLLLNLADSLNQLERYAEMVGALEQLVLIEPNSVAYERLGSGYFRLRRYEEALDAFNSSVNLDPNHYPGLNGIAVCELNVYLWNGKVDGGARERAVDAMRRSLRIERQQPRIVELLRRYGSPAGSER